jgi:DNA-binding CsgD family transcriptional regulator
MTKRAGGRLDSAERPGAALPLDRNTSRYLTYTMPHATIVYYVVVALTGFMAVAVSVLGTIRSKIGAYWLLIGFYGTLTVSIAITAVEQYLYLNVHPVPVGVFLTTHTIENILDAVFMCIVTLYFHRLFVEKGRRLRDWVVVGAYAAGLILILLPGSRTVDLARATLRLTALGSAHYSLFIALFAYLLVVGFAGQKRDRSVRELVLIWSLILFGLVVFLANIWSTIQFITGTREIPLTPAGAPFMVASVPYLLFGGILMYYFGAYVLADRQAPAEVSPTLVEDHGISPRERDIIPLLNQGLSNREIAEKLFVSLATVKTHIHNIYEKTGTKSRYELFNLTRR